MKQICQVHVQNGRSGVAPPFQPKETYVVSFVAQKLTKSTAWAKIFIPFSAFFHRSIIRFPSTNIRIEFENLVSHQQYDGSHSTNNKAGHNQLDNSAVIYSPLKITIPDNDKLKSPYPSPTGKFLASFSFSPSSGSNESDFFFKGTISAANSCPTSPRQGYHDFQNYHGHSSSHNFSNVSLFFSL